MGEGGILVEWKYGVEAVAGEPRTHTANFSGLECALPPERMADYYLPR